MSAASRKDFYRELKNSRSRFLSIMVLAALAVAFLSGLKVTAPDMKGTGDRYLDEQRLADIQILSTLGITEGDVAALAAREELELVRGGYVIDAWAGDLVTKVYSITPDMNELTVLEGRLPQAWDECAVDRSLMEGMGLSLGDTLSIAGGGDYEDALRGERFTVVGVVRSPYYISVERGSASIGSGTVKAYAYLREEAFDLDAYTVAWLRVKGAAELTAFCAEYDDYIDEVMDALEPLGDRRAQLRHDEIITEAEEKITEGEEKLADAREEAEQELRDAAAELADGRRELDDGWAEYEDGVNDLAEAERELADAEAELNDGYQQLLESEEEYEDALAQYEDGLAEYEDGAEQLAEGKAELEDAKAQLDAQKAELQSGEQQLNDGIAQCDTAVAEAEAGIAQCEAGIAQCESVMAVSPPESEAYQQAAAQKQTLLAQKAQAEAGITQAQAQKQTLLAQREELAAGRAQLDAAEAELAAGWAEYEENADALSDARQELRDAKRQLDDGRRELDDGWQDYHDGAQELSDGWAEYADGIAELPEAKAELLDAERDYAEGYQEYLDGKAEAEEKIADAADELADARRKLAEIESSEWYILPRGYAAGYTGFGQDADRMANLATVLPIIFFLVAALVCLTSMTRMVEEQRTQIGLMKALGYGRWSISRKYLSYALLPSLVGSALGLVIGHLLFPSMIYVAYQIMYEMPQLRLRFYPGISLGATGAAVGCTTAAAIFACMATLADSPANLMRPKAPKAGKRVLLERIRPLWSRMSFNWKITVRNLLRYLKRFWMTVAGIGGCTALIVVCFGLRASLMNTMGRQYDELFLYDVQATLSTGLLESERQELEEYLAQSDQVTAATELYATNVTAESDSYSILAFLQVMEPEQIGDFTVLRDNDSKAPIALTDEGAVIDKKLGELLGLSVGDRFTVTGDGRHELRVAAICENYVAHYIYLTPAYYEAVFGEAASPNSLLLNLRSDDAESCDTVLRELLALKGVASASRTADTRNTYLGSMERVDFVIVIVILCAAALAVVVLYNLSTINITERRRELATIKVLGFYDREVTAYVTRENMVLTVVGIAFGCLAGKLLHAYLMRSVEIDMMMFARDMTGISYVYAAALTAVFAAGVELLAHRRMKAIDMVESLKSAE